MSPPCTSSTCCAPPSAGETAGGRARATPRLRERGTHEADGVALGVRRLSIVDVEGGHQPFANEDGSVWAIQNGELYNHEALRGELRADGHSFRSRCDTEILPHLYERFGPAF